MSLWRKENAPQFAEELKGKSMPEMAKICAEKWAQVPAEEKAKYTSQVEDMKKEFDKKKDEFKTRKTYLDFLLERRKAKERENKTVGLINLPKRPQSVFAMFAEAHKTEVPAGKGEGKGRSALKAKFIEAPADEKAELAKKEAEAKQKFQSELAAFKESEEFKKYKGNEKKIQTEFMNEAMKVMTLKFLRHSPPAPPKTGFAVFVGDKRKAEEDADGAPKGKKERAEEVRAYKVEFMKLDKATKKEYDTSRMEKFKEWQAQVKEYMEKPMWKEYLAEAKRIKVPIKSLLADKGKVIKKLKNGMRFIPLPEKPVDMPVKPKQAYSLFVAAKKGSMELSEMPGAWSNLEEAERKKYTDEAADLQREYETNMKIFKESDEGKMWADFKDYSLTVRRKRVVLAKFKFLGGMPKKPVDPKAKWMKAAKAEFPGLKGADLTVKVMEKFRALPEEERDKIEKERQEQENAYRQSLKEFKESEHWQKYSKMVKAKAKSKGASTVPVPEDMPKKPRNALQIFRSEQAGKGLAEALKMFNDLPQEEKARRNQEAKEMQDKYVADLAAWGKTEAGKKYNKQVAMVEKRYKLNSAKERYLKNEPKKAVNAMQLWANEVGKALIQQEDPSVKGFAMLPKISQKWLGLSSEDKQEWVDKAAAGQEEYEKSMAEWKATPDYKKYVSIVSRLNGSKGAASKGKGKGAKPKAKAVEMPPKPEGMPKKPMTGYFIYMEEKRASGTGVSKSELASGWVNLGADGQKVYNDKSKEQFAKYDKDMVEFNKTAEGKKYKRLKAVADRKQRVENARKKFIGGADAPKKPTAPRGAYFIFTDAKRPTLTGLGFKEMAQKVSELWKDLPPEEKKVYEDKHAEQKEQFEKAMAEYRSHPSVKKFEKASGTAKKPKPKPKPKRKAAKPKGRAAGRGKAKAKPKARAAADKAGSGSDSDVMGSDSSSSSNDSDSD
ncbi:unnamed protein product [Prorocentrum cordatum]|uniref:HMG box domain-containing protein n=1 Tax=Prorocentrum cordatum TaxID=2364126 RepID=A0ABN9X089_9DINO|nr:unnamed protein product [Polarella glacialis]